MRRIAIAGLGIAFCAAGLSLAWRRHAFAAETPALSNSGSGAPVTSTSAETTREASLRPYFGARWNEALPLFAEAKFDLSEPFDQSLVPPWPEVQERLEFRAFVDESDIEAHRTNAVAWNDNLPFEQVDFSSPIYDPRERPLSADDLAAVRAIKDRYESLLLDLGAEAGALFTLAMQDAWSHGKLERYPLVALQPLETTDRRVRALRMINMSNWNVMLVLHDGEAPEYEEMLTRIGGIKAERLAAARDYLSAR